MPASLAAGFCCKAQGLDSVARVPHNPAMTPFLSPLWGPELATDPEVTDVNPAWLPSSSINPDLSSQEDDEGVEDFRDSADGSCCTLLSVAVTVPLHQLLEKKVGQFWISLKAHEIYFFSETLHWYWYLLRIAVCWFKTSTFLDPSLISNQTPFFKELYRQFVAS